MTKQEFLNLLTNLDNAGQKEIDNLESVLQEHSYFQIATILQAKIASRIDSPSKSRNITKAALYTADRANLKNIIEDRVILTQPAIEEEEKQELIPVDKEKVTATDIRNIVEEIKNPHHSPSDDLYKEVMKNLETLKSLRKKYEFLEEQEQQNEKEEVPEKEVKTAEKQKKTGKKTKKTLPSLTSKKAGKEDLEEENETEVEKNDKLQRVDIDEQNSLIELFIKNESQFSKKKPDATIENKNDLSEKSTTINDEIISENLALIMLNQGKTEKAIEIYKKLIWKFPQKKAYFASRIEELNSK